MSAPDSHPVTHFAPDGAGGINVSPPFNQYKNNITITRDFLHALPGCQPVKCKADIGPARRLRRQIVDFTGLAVWFSMKVRHVVSGLSTLQIVTQRYLEISLGHAFGKCAMHKAGLAFRSKAVQRWVRIKICRERISLGGSGNDS